MSLSGGFGVNPLKNYGATPSIPVIAPGYRFSDARGDWIIVTADGAITQYQWVNLELMSVASQAVFKAAAMTTTTAGSNNLQVGVYQGATAAATGDLIPVWIGRGGGAGFGIKGNLLINYVAGANINTTATAGACDDSSTTLVRGVVGLLTEPGTGTLAIELYASTWMYVN